MPESTSAAPATGQRAMTWRKSQASNPSGNCVELAELPNGEIAVRNSRQPNGSRLIYTRAEIAAFIRGGRAGDFDDLADLVPPSADPGSRVPVSTSSTSWSPNVSPLR